MATFEHKRYEADAGTIHPIRLASAFNTITPANTDPTGGINSPIKVKVSKSNRAHGIRPRGVTIARELTITVGSETYSHFLYKFVPILTKAKWDGTDFREGATVVYNGANYVVVGRSAEDY